MNLLLIIQVGFREVMAHKFRSFLTMFGIILGVASLAAMFSLLEGMTRGMRERLMMTGGVERISVVNQDVPIEQEELKTISPGRTLDDVEAILNECSLAEDVSPEMTLNNSTAILGRNSMRPRTIYGVAPAFRNVSNFPVEQGRFITDTDLETFAKVCVIGWPIWEQLEQPAGSSPIGKSLVINDIPFQIVGVFQNYESQRDRMLRESGKIAARQKRAEALRRGAQANQFQNHSWYRNNIIVIPITTMQNVFKAGSIDAGKGEKAPDRTLSGLHVRVRDINRIPEAIEQIKKALLKVHRRVEDFGFDTREDWAEDIESNISSTRLTGSIMSGISLLIGGIGIANIMLASISERIREIGIRMAVGAGRRDIFIQILVEGCLLSTLGGLLGLGASFGLIHLLTNITEMSYEPVVLTSNLMIAFFFSILTGILAGIYPALKASRLHPIQALRYE